MGMTPCHTLSSYTFEPEEIKLLHMWGCLIPVPIRFLVGTLNPAASGSGQTKMLMEASQEML